MNGWIVLDKPYGMTSAKATHIVRRLTGSKKAGHAGTLDPLATGILPIALNEATKTIPYLVAHTKQYRFQITWGEQRITDDAEGGIIATSNHRPSPQSIMDVLSHFKGTINQQAPLFSAVKVNGKRAYDLARTGQDLVIESLKEAIASKTRLITIYDLHLESIDSEKKATFLVTCGPGTYVRSLARDIGETLGTKGFVSLLRRLSVGKFHENNSISLEKLKEIGHKSELHRIVLPLGTVLDDIPAVSIAQEDAMLIRQGQRIPLSEESCCASLVVLKVSDEIVSIAENCDGYFYPKRVFLRNE